MDDRYEFEPFERQNYITDIQLGTVTMKLPDGLSHYMTVLGIAQAFDYSSEWYEVWKI